MLKFDRGEMETVARAVIRFNEYAAGDTVENVVTRMESVAWQEFGGRDKPPGYVGTYGFILSSFQHPGGGIGVKPSVSASLFDKLEG